MHVGLFEAWAGRKRTAALCPHCRSPRIRYSRRRYEGFAGTFFKVRPVKCLACGAYFVVGAKAGVAAGLDVSDLRLPFQPSEMEGRERRDSGEVLPQHLSSPDSKLPAMKCPDCGSRSARPFRSGMEASVFRLDAREAYRCSACNASFMRTSPIRFLVLLLLLSSVLGGAAYLINNVRFGSTTNKASPRIRQNQVPKVPPPVFR